jgi:hypothetical protein
VPPGRSRGSAFARRGRFGHAASAWSRHCNRTVVFEDALSGRTLRLPALSAGIVSVHRKQLPGYLRHQVCEVFGSTSDVVQRNAGCSIGVAGQNGFQDLLVIFSRLSNSRGGSGHDPIDNNGCENSIRPFVIGRRNWLFADTVAGADASANLYSLLETCKVNGVDGYQYLRALLLALPRAKTADDFEALLPWRIAGITT